MPDGSLMRALREELDQGESAALTLACEQRADLVLIDERKGRLAAARLGLVSRGTIGVLVEGKRAEKIATLAPLLDVLSKKGVWLSQQLIATALRSVGEQP